MKGRALYAEAPTTRTSVTPQDRAVPVAENANEEITSRTAFASNAWTCYGRAPKFFIRTPFQLSRPLSASNTACQYSARSLPIELRKHFLTDILCHPQARYYVKFHNGQACLDRLAYGLSSR